MGSYQFKSLAVGRFGIYLQVTPANTPRPLNCVPLTIIINNSLVDDLVYSYLELVSKRRDGVFFGGCVAQNTPPHLFSDKFK